MELAYRDRRPPPPKIANAPELQLGLDLYYMAFWELTTCRQLGMGLGPIDWLSTQHYGISMGLDEDQMEELHYYVSAMDDFYMKHNSKTQGSGSGSKSPPARS